MWFLLLFFSTAVQAANVDRGTVYVDRGTVSYRSILGDPGMRWKQKEMIGGPRMQLYFYNLCSKAGYRNMSVVPSTKDTCTSVDDVIVGIGSVKTVYSDDCCTACLQEPWCLAWTKWDSMGAHHVCELKDNTLPRSIPPPLDPSDFEPRKGNCGGTKYEPPASCQTHMPSGAIRAQENGITTFKLCKDYCLLNCSATCNFVSFSASHDDCSWYSQCSIRKLAPEADYVSSAVRQPSRPTSSGLRVYHPAQQIPSPRYANCVVGGKQTITVADNNEKNNDDGEDDEWFAVLKEHALAQKCAVASPQEPTPSFFWTLMSQNGNAPATLGSANECLPFCFADYGNVSGYPPAVNASSRRCPNLGSHKSQSPWLLRRKNTTYDPLAFNRMPMNQAKVMVRLTDPSTATLEGHFNWTFELDADLTVSESEFPKNKSLGIWSWRFDTASNKGIVRVYQRVSSLYPWICTYFGVDVNKGVKGNQAYDGRGMMLESPVVGKDFVVRFFLNITKDEIGGGGGIGSWYLLNMESCWNQLTGKRCEPYGNTNENVHQQVLLDYGGGDSCTIEDPSGCPLYHILRNGTKIHRLNKAHFPYTAYKQYCCPCTSCTECHDEPLPCCDPMSNSNGQSIYKLAPDLIWAEYGFPHNATDGFVGRPKMHELHVGALWEQIWFPCMTKEPIEIITLNIGPETGLGTGTHDTEFFVSDFDVLVP